MTTTVSGPCMEREIDNWIFGFAIVALCLSACANPVGVGRLDERAAHRELTANVLSIGNQTRTSTQLVVRQTLSERFDRVTSVGDSDSMSRWTLVLPRVSIELGGTLKCAHTLSPRTHTRLDHFGHNLNSR